MASRQLTLSGVVLNETVHFSLGEVCQCCDVSAEYVVSLVDEGVVAPEGAGPEEWHFHGEHLRRVQVAVRLGEDLGVNLPGVALALELLDELEALRRAETNRIPRQRREESH
ncbi:hypothetical protein CAI21_05655 [Alkalilimnicola ehrlichii]|uniref:MerR family transcriptional regulator n=1 Tax=Alkalilimnicola ehrlichii TaxID=351052 RepID=A0A3E0WZ40_9GAMM|nr:chaperone modulator CbpM [Alkalilimnicola ehrlichii]RFA30531.1 hypothetical protein CAI21_05655 [Alkalilimnicola ehrlichii]RFA38078.1 hypothetical protein CAL65_07025 [Alkalilimnicola ehrlichii]